MAKRKRRNSNQSNWSGKVGVILLVAVLLVGCYFYLKKEDKLPSGIEKIKVEKIWNKTVKETDEITDKFLDKVENGLEDAKEKLAEKRESSRKSSKGSQNTSNESAHNSTGHRSEANNYSDNAETDQRPGSLNLKLEIPVSIKEHDEIVLKRMAYTVSYNNKMKNPNWVAWELTRKELIGKEERTDKFVPDPDLPEPRVKTSDYTRSGYDRGHMAPAADMKWSTRAMEESFYMSNICPQHKNLNRGDWNDLEDACRAWAKKYGTVYIACGPIYDHSKPKRIGASKVAVPDRFFKVVLIYNRKDPMALGFIFPNIAHSQDLSQYQVTVDDVEFATGFDFFSKLPDHVEDYIEAEIRQLPSTRK